MIKMAHVYRVNRKLQEQAGSYFVILPKLWIESLGLKQGSKMSIVFNGDIKISPATEAKSGG